MTRRRMRWWGRAAACVLLLSACGFAPAPPAPIPAGPAGAFPRTAAVFLGQDALPPLDVTSRYDVVVVDNEWAHRDPDYLRELRRRDPGVLLLAYVNLVDRPRELGSSTYYANRYALWQFTDPETSRFPAAWSARTAAGQPVSEYPDTVMANLSATAPTVGGRSYPQYAADWVADTVWSSGLWDGIFLDVWGDTVYSVDTSAWDVAHRGVDVSGDRIFGADSPWARGLTVAEQRMRERMPDAVLVANGDRSMTGGQLNGRVWESFADPTADRSQLGDIAQYVDVSSQLRRTPVVPMTINLRRSPPATPEDFRAARFQLTSTLLQNGYWAPADDGYGSLEYYDELDGGGLGRGYLGDPTSPSVTLDRLQQPFAAGVGVVGKLVARRDFTKGIVVVNASDTAQTVDLAGEFQHLRGAQDPTVNDGSVVRSVSLQPHDGVVLLRR